jgi:hypothetical protein
MAVARCAAPIGCRQRLNSLDRPLAGLLDGQRRNARVSFLIGTFKLPVAFIGLPTGQRAAAETLRLDEYGWAGQTC